MLGTQYLAGHQAGHGAAGTEAASLRLYVVGHAQIEFALHQQIQWLCQLLGDAGNLACRGGPVLASESVAATDRLGQQAFAVDQCHRHTVDLGLNPDIVATLQPGFDGATVMQFPQAGLGDGVSNGATCRAQRFGGGAGGEAFSPFVQSNTGLVVEFVGDQ
ncbi:hypothetical protein D3C85_1297130 [compost metagenome]